MPNGRCRVSAQHWLRISHKEESCITTALSWVCVLYDQPEHRLIIDAQGYAKQFWRRRILGRISIRRNNKPMLEL
ncbi:hypothetical protein BDV09DRAFT_166354 [Aspergillus tetrazonus]